MLYKLVRQDKFPHPTPMSNRSIGWFGGGYRKTGYRLEKQLAKSISHSLVYMAGRMGEPVGDKKPGGDFSCWRIFDVSKSNALGD